MTLTAALDDADRRLDRILRKALPELPLSALHRLLRQGKVLVNGSPAAGSDHIPAGAQIEIKGKPETRHGLSGKTPPAKQRRINRAKKELDILWESAGLLILNKAAGLAVHGAPDSLDLRVQAYLADKLPPSLSFKPGPLHRLDKPTSGIVVFSKTLEAARRFSALLVQGKIRKRYLAILEGELKNDEVWEEILVRDKAARKTLVKAAEPEAALNTKPGVAPNTKTQGAAPDKAPGAAPDKAPGAMPDKTPGAAPDKTQGAMPDTKMPGGRRALTRVTPLAWAEGAAFTYARLEIETGRTHQIRAQAASHGHPLAGDRKYGGTPLNGKGFFLHAAELELPEQAADILAAKDFPRTIKAPLPDAFSRMARNLRLPAGL